MNPTDLALSGLSAEPIRRIVFSPDGRTAVIGYQRSGLEFRSLVGGEDRFLEVSVEDQRLAGFDTLRAMAYSPDGLTLYVGKGVELYALDASTGVIRWRYRAPNSYGFLPSAVASLAVSPDGRVACAFDHGGLALLNSDGRMESYHVHHEALFTLEFVTEGRLVGVSPHGVWEWALPLGEHPRSLGRFGERIHSSVIGHGWIAARTLSEVEVRDLETFDLIQRHEVGVGAPTLAAHPDRDEIAFSEESKIVTLALDGERTTWSCPSLGAPTALAFGSELWVAAQGEAAPIRELLEQTVQKSVHAVPAPSQVLHPVTVSRDSGYSAAALTGLAVALPPSIWAVNQYVFQHYQISAFDRIVSTAFFGFLLASPALFVGLALAWLIREIREWIARRG